MNRRDNCIAIYLHIPTGVKFCRLCCATVNHALTPFDSCTEQGLDCCCYGGREDRFTRRFKYDNTSCRPLLTEHMCVLCDGMSCKPKENTSCPHGLYEIMMDFTNQMSLVPDRT